MSSIGRNGGSWWRSLKARSADAELENAQRDEFPADADQSPDSLSRRRFIQVMGASAALAGMTGCRWPAEKILPYRQRPSGQDPATTKLFATGMDLGGVGRGLLATSFEGRPIKIEGNPSHSASLGAADSFAQASVLELYDPDRSKTPVHEGSKSDWEAWDAAARQIFGPIRRARGRSLAILSTASSSLAEEEYRKRLARELPEARWVNHEVLSRDEETRGMEIAFGERLRPRYDLARADRILCLDEDLLGSHPDALALTRSFSRRRRAEDGKMNRLYVLEPAFTVTGGMADHRLPLAAGQIEHFLRGLADALGLPGLSSAKPGQFGKALASDLLAHRGRSLICAGPRQPARVHALVALLNERLGNVGSTVSYSDEFLPSTGGQALADLHAALTGGEVTTLLILGANPVYDAPSDLDFADALSEVTAIHLGLHRDETAEACNWHLPAAHALETWSSCRSWDGTITPIQPLIEPLYSGRTREEILSSLFGRKKSAWDLTRASLARDLGGDLEKRWRLALHEGFIAGSASSLKRPGARVVAVKSAMENTGSASKGMELVFAPDASVYDGRFANNAWLQETPDPVSKLTWGNAAQISPATADHHGLRDGSLLELELSGAKVTVPAQVIPGIAPDSVILPVGYGRQAVGRVGREVGSSAHTLRRGDMGGFARGLEISDTGRRYPLATTQDHWQIDKLGFEERARRVPHLLRQGDVEQYRRHPDFARKMDHHPPLESLWREHDYEGHRWGMAIDLNACTGCSACAVACQAENNVPVVGREDILKGREMSWIRLDRYFRGDIDQPEMAHQPMACAHCELAPCEAVCPVGATAHSDEGLNDMAYNRCIGTRYCANNCPYKVRRFNWFDYTGRVSDTESMAYNPDVSVRGRGVMEKCSYCVQRIEAARAEAKVAGRELVDGDIVPACAQTCPAEAIVFGDLGDEGSRVSSLHANQRGYALLAELNIKPRTAYLARLRNPNPILAEAPVEHGHHR